MKPAQRRIALSVTLLAVPIIAATVGIALEVRQTRLDRDLILALKRHDADIAIRLLLEGADANARDKPFTRVTIQSAFADLSANLRGKKPPTGAQAHPVAIAVWYAGNLPEYPESVPMMRALLEHGADPNAKNEAGDYSVLLSAVAANHLETVSLLLAHGADPNYHTDHYLFCPLAFANAKTAELLIAHRADVNFRDITGATPLAEAVGSDDDKARLLIAHGADVNSRDHFGFTPLSMAAIRKDVSATQLLWEHGAEINAHNDDDSVLISAMYADKLSDGPGLVKEVRWLVEHGAKVNIRDEFGRTVVELAESDPVDPASKAAVVRLLQQKLRAEAAATRRARRRAAPRGK